ncbi:MAG TPA: hypothetical protein VGR19_11850 [Allosphingosinicella sp.]|nr:hypothetical protein [Allosphingosinicella sp.]
MGTQRKLTPKQQAAIARNRAMRGLMDEVPDQSPFPTPLTHGEALQLEAELAPMTSRSRAGRIVAVWVFLILLSWAPIIALVLL